MILDDLTAFGYSSVDLLVKSDQEPAIIELQGEIASKRGYEDYGVGTGIENSKVGDSNSNGKIERAIQDVAKLVRTLRSALEAKLNTKVMLNAPVVPWLIRHGAENETRFHIGRDGMSLTAHRR